MLSTPSPCLPSLLLSTSSLTPDLKECYGRELMRDVRGGSGLFCFASFSHLFKIFQTSEEKREEMSEEIE